MKKTLSERLLRWKASPHKWEIGYIASGTAKVARDMLHRDTDSQTQDKLLVPPIESTDVEILLDSEFLRSVNEIKELTCLDFARLANIWMLVQRAAPGLFFEVGSFKGGTARHICNAMPQDAPFYCFDPFEKGGFEGLGPDDSIFKPMDFTDTQYERVVLLLASKPNATVIQGFFPAAAEGLDLHDISFCHLDVDTYEATRNSLEFLAPRLAQKGIIVVDDYGHRETPGVVNAVADFLAAHPSFFVLPMFPCQAVILSKDLW
jgi:Methyltransferase domain